MGDASDIEKEINDVKAQLLAVERELKDLLSAALPEDRKQRERERLLKEKEQLREKENQLREKENLLLKLQLQQPGYAGAPSSGSGAAGLTTLEQFTDLLKSGEISVQQHVLDTIKRTPTFAAQLNLCRSIDDAAHLYALASTVLHTETKQLVKTQSDIVVDGPLPVVVVQSAMFFYAFKGTVPSVLKVPITPGKTVAECELWKTVSPHLPSSGETVCLVPVTYVSLAERYSVNFGDGSTESTLIRAGIFMPLYGCTLDTLPSLAEQDALLFAERVSFALDFLHERHWMHGDVKPSNIFIDFAGKPWLGDYGSSVEFSRLKFFTGGTPAFQCEDVDCEKSPGQFDKMGLLISLLVKLKALEQTGRSWPRTKVSAGLELIVDPGLRSALKELLGS